LEEDNVRQGFIEQGQYLSLLNALPDHLKTLLVVGYHCGNQLGELRTLRWNQVDLEAREIRIQGAQAKAKRPQTRQYTVTCSSGLRGRPNTTKKAAIWSFTGMGSRSDRT